MDKSSNLHIHFQDDPPKCSLSVEEIAKSVELLKRFALCSVAITPVTSASAKKPSAVVSPRHRVLGDPNAVAICAVPFQNMSRTLLALNNCTVLSVTSSKCLLSVEEIARSVERLKHFSVVLRCHYAGDFGDELALLIAETAHCVLAIRMPSPMRVTPQNAHCQSKKVPKALNF
ncbi:hypothetical protein niasHT_034131 [Heterodera trifolii]|uniref:Uncharacterized protein n=1 Tax=Heterodera trifolii TaxID=157864 RepID=A0ABD2J5I6_9BILA